MDNHDHLRLEDIRRIKEVKEEFKEEHSIVKIKSVKNPEEYSEVLRRLAVT